MFTTLLCLLGAAVSVYANPADGVAVTKDGISIHYTQYGNPSNPAMVFIHGYPYSAATWDQYMYYYKSLGYYTVAYDRRGFGESSNVDWGFDFDTLADDLDTVVSHLNLNNFTLIGHSMGTGEILRYTSGDRASKVNKAILLGAFAPAVTQQPNHPYGPTVDQFLQANDSLYYDASTFLLGDTISFFDIDPTNATQVAMNQGLTLDFWRVGSMATYTVLWEALKSIGTTDFYNDCVGVTVPTLLIHGTEDTVANYTYTAKLAADLIPGAQLITYEGSGHTFYVQEKVRTRKDMLDFLTAP